MKKAFLLLFSLFTFLSFGQKINDYEFVMVPTKFDFFKRENEHRLNTILKFRLEEYGFKAFYTSQQLNTNYEDRCRYMNVNLIEDSGFLNTKLSIVFKDCNGLVIFQSPVGMSKQKNRTDAYVEALEMALQSVKALNYKFSGVETKTFLTIDSEEEVVPKVVEKKEFLNSNMLSAQPIVNGFQLVDLTPKIILKMLKTSVVDSYIATSEAKNGVVFKKNNEWFFEYYVGDKLTSEKLNIKF